MALWPPARPEYRPIESEFADPIAFLSRVEREAAAYGICKVISPYPSLSHHFVFAHLNCSLVTSFDGPDPLSRLTSSTFAENNGSLLESSDEEEEEGTNEALPHAAVTRSSDSLSPVHFESMHHWSGAKS